MRRLCWAACLVVPSLVLGAPTPPGFDDIETALFETASVGLWAVIPAAMLGVGTVLVAFWLWRSGKKLISGRTKSL